jgi:hypothetical protein
VLAILVLTGKSIIDSTFNPTIPTFATLSNGLLMVAVLGVVLITLGGVVLLLFPDRPGGEVQLLGFQVSSVGAGLPLIALGVVLVAIVAVH